MGFLTNLFRGRIIDKVEELIIKWQPTGCSTEEDYENSLHQHLKSNLGKVKITKKHAVGDSQVDFLIYNNVLVEVKKNLDSDSRLQSIVKEIESCLSEAEYVILVLFGKIANSLLKQLREKYANELTKGRNEDHRKLTIIKG